MMPPGNKRNIWPTTYRQAYPQIGQNEAEKCNHGMDWVQKKLFDIE